MKKIKIADRLIGKRDTCFIIAEAGLNHNGSLKLAKRLVDTAKKAGADAVKFQTFMAENLVTEKAETGANIKRGKNQLAILKELELDYKDFITLKRYCSREKIIFLSTPHSEEAIDFLEPLVPAYKVASGDLTNLPFLEKIARKNKPVILSSGMSALDEVKEAVEAIRKQRNNKIILLHCTTDYPCPLEEVNLRAMKTMKEKLNCLVGYSDHTLGITVPIAAASLGAVVIEKHFTLDRRLPGADHRVSLEPAELKTMVRAVRESGKILGSPLKKPAGSEKKIKKIMRKSLVARTFIARGEKITLEKVGIKRPEGGIEPKYLKKIIGKKAKKNVEKDEFITWRSIQ